jgi:hypothetical protein
MNLAVVLTFQAIENLLNEKFGELLHEGNAHNPGGIITYVRVFKTDRIKVYRQGEHIVSVIPVRVRVSMRKNDPLLIAFIKDLSNVEKTSFDILVEFKTSVFLEDEGKISARTVSSFTWINKPKVGIGLLKVKITELVKPALDKELLALTQEIDESIVKAVNIRGYMSLAFAELNKPIEIISNREQGSAASDWFIANPSADTISTGKIQLARKGIVMPVKFNLNPLVFLGSNDHGFRYESAELPPIVLRENLKSWFSLNVESKIAYSVIINELINQEFELENGKSGLKITQADFYPSADDFIAKTAFVLWFRRFFLKIQVKGNANIKTRVKIEGEGEIFLENFQLEVTNLPFWARLIYRLNRKNTERKVAKAIGAAILAQIILVKEEISTLLKAYHLGNGLELQTRIEEFTPLDIKPEAELLAVPLRLEGEMDFVITELNGVTPVDE